LYGEENANLYLDLMDRDDPEACVRAFLAGLQALGRARPRRVETTPRGYRFVIEDAWDAREAGCNHTRGMIAGFLSVLLGAEFSSRARVEDNLCVIELERI
ncbi:MAG: hypothetical protein QI199_04475, partial [Candidatus Korarchaeota archaeon]|nr:hypothetical protein [Candidatus Korarchaeota archaeon]